MPVSRDCRSITRRNLLFLYVSLPPLSLPRNSLNTHKSHVPIQVTHDSAKLHGYRMSDKVTMAVRYTRVRFMI